ncbi:MAG: amidohydrolase family protein [Rubripirellula sp.]
MRLASAFLIYAFSVCSAVQSQSLNTKPVVGLRDAIPTAYALTKATVVVRPGEVIHDATVLIESQQVMQVGQGVEIPSEYRTIDCDGKYIYAGFIDAWSEQAAEIPDASSGYWNQNIIPQRNVSDSVNGAKDEEKLRGQGFAARLVAPQGAIVKGTSALYLLGGGSRANQVLGSLPWQHAQLTVPRNGPRERYPNSPMGATALLRQAFYDAQWYNEAWEVSRANLNAPQPEYNFALEKLSRDMRDHWFIFDAPNERMALRADQIGKEFALKVALRGSGREYRDVEAIAEMNRPLLIPINFPATPNVKDAQSRENVSLLDLMHWDLAPTNPARLDKANVRFCLTTDGLDNVSDFMSNLRQAFRSGLNPETALAALTTLPAELLGVEHQLGSVRKGYLANLVIFDKEFSDDDAKVEECWVAGIRYPIKGENPYLRSDRWDGQWLVNLPGNDKGVRVITELTVSDGKVSGSMVLESEDTLSSSRDAGNKNKKKKRSKATKVDLETVNVERDRISATIDLSDVDPAAQRGISTITIIRSISENLGRGPSDPVMNLYLPDGVQASLKMIPIARSTGEDLAVSKTEAGTPETPSKAKEWLPTDTPVLKPLGAYGLEKPREKTDAVVFRKATIWTCSESGRLAEADLLIQGGVIAAIGNDLEVPKGTREFDLEGKHITPGLIDCHTHMGTDGGVNESGQVVTAEVRIGDFIDNSDINIYRQLAGGLTTANILHGSANPIGGQNQVIKLRWGDSMEGLKMKQAPAGIKFALGENVKRNPSRYPNTRMGVEQIIRDQLLAAREYDAQWRRWRSGDRSSLPPRVDLQLEALSQVQRGERWIHCHSYRQDEIVSTLGVLEEFGIQIGTLQHILEGYKVADRIRQHGAMASAFSDWWAYKFEVFDAIPYNGAIMHNQGVVVSFNSDDRELARHLNTEAAKATKYGGVPEEDALKFVTLNPAKQLRIDHLVGSLEVGKHADLAIWSGRPLSTLTRCEQTWIDGIQYFDIEQDQELRQRDLDLRARLIQKAMGGKSTGGAQPIVVQEEDRWVRKDIYCATHGGLRHEATNEGGQK